VLAETLGTNECFDELFLDLTLSFKLSAISLSISERTSTYVKNENFPLKALSEYFVNR